MGSALDNVVPTAFEEADAGMATGLVLSGGVIGSTWISYYNALPAFSGAQIGISSIPMRSGGSAGSYMLTVQLRR